MGNSWASMILVLPLTFAIATELNSAPKTLPSATCAGSLDDSYQGTWNFKGGRPMSVALASTSVDHMQVTINYLGLEAPLEGTCVIDEDRGAVLTFGGPDQNGLTHSGALYLEPEGHLSGAIDGYSFQN